MKIVNITTGSLQTHAKYYNKTIIKIHEQSDFFKQVLTSVAKNGLINPLIIDKHYKIIIGHNRFLVARKLKLKTVPCMITDDISKSNIDKLIKLNYKKIKNLNPYQLTNEKNSKN